MNDWINDYKDYCCEITDAPPEYHQYVGLSLIGSLLGKKVYFLMGDTEIYPNLWMILLAPSSLYRKSTSIHLGCKIISSINRDIFYPPQFSQEKILEILNEKSSGLFVFYEFLSFTKMLEKEYMAGTKAIFTELFDVPDYFSRKTKSVEVNIKKPCISILSATTVNWFLEAIKEQDMMGGFLPRFLYVPAQTKLKDNPLPDPVDKALKRKIATQLHFLISPILNTKDPICLKMSSESKKLYINWYSKYSDLINFQTMKHKTFMVRFNIYLIKFAIICQSLEGFKDNYIHYPAMEKAIAYINCLEQKIINLCEDELAFTFADKSKKKILKIIREGQEDGVKKSEILHKSGMLSHYLNKVLSSLIEEDRIVLNEIKGITKPLSIYKIIL